MPGSLETKSGNCLLMSIRVSCMFRVCWVRRGEVTQPLLISTAEADSFHVFIPPLTIVTEAQGRKCLKQITSIMHQLLMKRFCLRVWVHLVWTRKCRKSCNPPMSINPSSVISTAGVLFSSRDLTFYLVIYSWPAVAHSNCPQSDECFPGGLILSLRQIITSLIAAVNLLLASSPVWSRTVWSLFGTHVPTGANLGCATSIPSKDPLSKSEIRITAAKKALQEPFS